MQASPWKAICFPYLSWHLIGFFQAQEAADFWFQGSVTQTYKAWQYISKSYPQIWPHPFLRDHEANTLSSWISKPTSQTAFPYSTHSTPTSLMPCTHQHSNLSSMIRLCHPLNKQLIFCYYLEKKFKILTLLYTVLHNKLNSPFFFFFNLFSFHLKTCFSKGDFSDNSEWTWMLNLSSPRDKFISLCI